MPRIAIGLLISISVYLIVGCSEKSLLPQPTVTDTLRVRVSYDTPVSQQLDEARQLHFLRYPKAFEHVAATGKHGYVETNVYLVRFSTTTSGTTAQSQIAAVLHLKPASLYELLALLDDGPKWIRDRPIVALDTLTTTRDGSYVNAPCLDGQQIAAYATVTPYDTAYYFAAVDR